MTSVKYFENVSVSVPLELILFRMGYKKGITEIDAGQNERIVNGIEKGRSLCAVKAAYGIYKITANDGNKITLENGFNFESTQLAKLLAASGEVVLMASTAGSDVVKARDEEIKAGDAALGVIIDAAASEIADAGLDFIQELIGKTLIRSGKRLTRRYSPGYGDLKLEGQKIIHNALELGKIGIEINDRYILTPEKSVLAIAGIE